MSDSLILKFRNYEDIGKIIDGSKVGDYSGKAYLPPVLIDTDAE